MSLRCLYLGLLSSMFWSLVIATSAPSVAVTIDCCTLVKILYRYMSVDDKYLPCAPMDARCPSLRLIQLFMQHTSTTLNSGNPAIVRDSNLVFTVPTDDSLAQMLVFAFFGRSVSPADESDTAMWLSYDAKLNKIRFEESECELNRNVYTTLILASLVLLMFFVAISVIANTDVSAATPTIPAAVQVATHKPQDVANSHDVKATHLLFCNFAEAPRLRFSR